MKDEFINLHNEKRREQGASNMIEMVSNMTDIVQRRAVLSLHYFKRLALNVSGFTISEFGI